MIGELAALGTSVLWAANAVFFSEGAKRIDALSVSVIRLVMASIILVAIYLATGGRFIFPPQSLLWILASGILALAVGDWFLFAALGKIGARITMLIMSLSPVFAAIIAWIFLGEKLSWLAIIGITVTIGGICMVILNRKSNQHLEKKELITGVFYSVIAALGQGGGFVLVKHGMSFGVNEFDALLLRVLVSVVAVALFVVLTGKTKTVIKSAKNLKAMLFVFLGTTVGLIAGSLLGFVAVNNTKIGVATTLISTSPIVLLPVARFIYKEKVTLIAIVGTIVTIGGVALLLLR